MITIEARIGATTSDRSLNRFGTMGVILACLGVMAVFTLSGCTGSSAHAVDSSRARDALVMALDHWKSGDALKSVTAMTIQDFDWAGGAQLLDYQVEGDGQAKGANLSIKVKLTLAADPRKSKGKNVEKSVYYLVGTSPSVTVFRDMLRR